MVRENTRYTRGVGRLVVRVVLESCGETQCDGQFPCAATPGDLGGGGGSLGVSWESFFPATNLGSCHAGFSCGPASSSKRSSTLVSSLVFLPDSGFGSEWLVQLVLERLGQLGHKQSIKMHWFRPVSVASAG